MESIQGMESLRCVSLTATPFSDRGMQYVAALPELRELAVGTGVTDSGLAKLRGHPTLEAISLARTSVTDKGLSVLGDIPGLSSLVLFDDALAGASFTEAAFEYLRNLTNLRTITVHGNWVSEAGVRALEEALPDCQGPRH